MPSRVTELELMLRVQADDADAFGLLYDRLAPAAMRVAQAICGDRNRAEDAVQEAFLSAWRSRSAYRAQRGAVGTWVLGIVRNRAIDSLRRDMRHDRAHDGREDILECLPDRLGVEAEVVKRDEAQRLRAALMPLPVTQREAVALAFFGQLSHSEVARTLGVPLGTVKGRIRLALDKLGGQIAA